MLKSTSPALLLVLLLAINVNAQFTKCNDYNDTDAINSSLCTSVKVPLNHNTPGNDSIDIFIRKFPALKKRAGSIWLISGGPGESGASLYPLITLFSETFPHLDIYIPDHRGTGLSGKICPKEESVDSPNGIALANDEWGSCFNHMYTNTPYVQAFSITNAAKDLSFLINDLSGSGKRYVYGVSYGTQLIMRLLQLDNTSLDGVILDSFVPLQDDTNYDLSHRSFIVNEVGNSVLKRFDTLISQDDNSLTSQLKSIIEKSKTEPDFAEKLPKQELTLLFGMMLDIPKVRNKIPLIIDALSHENVEPLNDALKEIEEFHKDYGNDYNSSPSSIPLVQIISSSENNLRPTLKPKEIVAESENFLFTSILPKIMADNAMPTYQKDNYFANVPKSMPPTLILHGTLDPKTPLSGAINHFNKLPKDNPLNLIKIKDAPHFIALFAPESFSSLASKFVNGESIKSTVISDKDTLLK